MNKSEIINKKNPSFMCHCVTALLKGKIFMITVWWFQKKMYIKGGKRGKKETFLFA
jgi:hypothetical protein